MKTIFAQCAEKLRRAMFSALGIIAAPTLRCGRMESALGEDRCRRDSAALDVFPVERRRPSLASVARGFPQLSHAAVRISRPSNFLHDRFVGTVRGGGKNHFSRREFPVQQQTAAAAIHPELMPLLVGRVVEVQALPGDAAGAAPVFEHAAAVVDALDAAVADLSAAGIEYIPSTQPKIELPVLGCRA